MFWSEGGAKAPVHHDEVDVIVIQLVGTKRWFISDATPTLPNQWRGLGETSAVMNSFKTYDVQPGDLLYVPRGTVHTVESISESIHLSIGFVPVTQRDAIIAALDLLSAVWISPYAAIWHHELIIWPQAKVQHRSTCKSVKG